MRIETQFGFLWIAVASIHAIWGAAASADTKVITECLDNDTVEMSSVQVWIYSKPTEGYAPKNSDQNAQVYKVQGGQRTLFESYEDLMVSPDDYASSLVFYGDEGNQRFLSFKLANGFRESWFEARNAKGHELTGLGLDCKQAKITQAEMDRLP
jgi:hypothetical protein